MSLPLVCLATAALLAPFPTSLLSGQNVPGEGAATTAHGLMLGGVVGLLGLGLEARRPSGLEGYGAYVHSSEMHEGKLGASKSLRIQQVHLAWTKLSK